MAAVIVPDGYQSEVLQRWQDVGQEIGRQPGDVIHWVKVRSHGQRLHLAQALASFERAFIVAVVFSKWDTPNTSREGVHQPDYLYNWLLRLKVERLSWFARDRDDTIRLTFAQVQGMNPAKLQSYVELLKTCDTTIAWHALHLPIRVDTPANRRMLQLPDTACGVIGSAFEWDDFGNNELRYLEIVRPRLWCRSPGKLHSYGLKISPFPHPRHDWATEYCGRR